MKRKYGIGLWWMLLVCYSSAIFFMSSRGVPKVARSNVLHLDKVEHFLAYALWSWICSSALTLSWPRSAWRRTFFLAGTLGALYGATDELHQWFVPERESDLADLAADVMGALAGALAHAWWRERRRVESGL